MRGNKQIWRMAEHLCQELDVMAHAFPNYWKDNEAVRNYYYDKALELQRKMINNEFTGPDNHDN